MSNEGVLFFCNTSKLLRSYGSRKMFKREITTDSNVPKESIKKEISNESEIKSEGEVKSEEQVIDNSMKLAKSDQNVDSISVKTNERSVESQEGITNDIPHTLLLSEKNVSDIERQLTKHERVSISFLFFDDIVVSLKYCSKSHRQMYRGLFKYAIRNSSEEWGMKLLECLYLVKNYFLLERFGFDRFVAAEIFKKTSRVLPERATLYKICDSLNRKDTEKVMNSVPTMQKEKYLELFFLNVTHQWNAILGAMKKLEEPSLSHLVDDLDALLVKKRVVKAPASPLTENIAAGCGVYPIKNPDNVGLCLIFNQAQFKSLPVRKGSEKDVEALKLVMNELSFNVIAVDNLPQKNFGVLLQTFILKNFKEDHSVFFLVILSHGSEGKIYCSDDLPIPIEEIFKMLHAVPELRNIPKVIIIQACQGDKYLKSDKVETDGVLPENLNTHLVTLTAQMKNQIGEYISDAFIVMSTVPGFKSFRQTDTGSNFIQYLCHCLRNNPEENFYDIVTEVMRLVTEEVVLTKIKKLNFTQQPECRSLLKKKLILKPKKSDQ